MRPAASLETGGFHRGEDRSPPARLHDTHATSAAAARSLHARVRDSLAALRRESGDRTPPASLAAHVREVVVIASSSRGGSSLLAEMLRGVPALAHFPGEINPALRLADLLFPCTSSSSDALVRTDLTPEALREVDQELSAQCGLPASMLSGSDDLERFALHLACRLALQWPDEAPTLGEVRAWMQEALEACGWRPDLPLDVVAFHVAFLACAHRARPRIDPRRYDLPEDRVGRPHPHAGPPATSLVEEPPFVAVGPWTPLTAEELASHPLVVKTPSNVYRLDALGALFPRARVRILHLVRNAGASINGLYDGWRHHGFFAHHVDTALAIRGYSELGAWARHQWKFDLPPGWQEHATSSLVDVCAFQWRSAHQAVLAWLGEHPDADRFRLRFEDLIAPTVERRLEAWSALEAWMGVPLLESLDPAIRQGLPPIMATQRPSRRRWTSRAALLEPVLATPAIRDTMEALGYDADPRTWD